MQAKLATVEGTLAAELAQARLALATSVSPQDPHTFYSVPSSLVSGLLTSRVWFGCVTVASTGPSAHMGRALCVTPARRAGASPGWRGSSGARAGPPVSLDVGKFPMGSFHMSEVPLYGTFCQYVTAHPGRLWFGIEGGG